MLKMFKRSGWKLIQTFVGSTGFMVIWFETKNCTLSHLEKEGLFWINIVSYKQIEITLYLLASIYIIIHNIKPYKLHRIACIRMIFYSIGGIFQIKRE